ncbi:M10 family metallopeptidase C-terminal domain-containing protein [Antarcticimicrobium luteum]|uniref:Integrin beta subunit VWA domain-containing protein n=1 Tax=Antarcticimicrobium luteum TaxID=2547397 RepID=A0A4R5V6M1_9RHOB|nr:M10 family metallopeptidase C-terminal domain-containing protein [Antarcticimicrobium luteum]TDK47461.1 hypothetical protein E1832_11285 [Antarcticimicrobium luteum]
MKVQFGEDGVDDVLAGTLRNDQLIGLSGDDVLLGHVGDDILEGGEGWDYLIGGIGDDLLLGGNKRDVFELTQGDDTAFGGDGNDHFVVNGFAGDHVVITDTSGRKDTIDFSGGITSARIDMNAGAISTVDDRTIELTGLSDDDGARALEMVLLEDLSGSFGDDISTVSGLADDLVTAISGLAADVELGLASFIDKPISPFGSTSDHEYQTQLALTGDYDSWKTALDALVLGSGADGPESQLTGLMQVALRTAEVGWSSDALKVVVLATDAVPHMAGDFSTVPSNDGDNVTDGPGDDGTGEDYPSLDQVKDALLKGGIIPIFAVSDFGTTVTEAYQDIVDFFGFGTVVDLSSDSSDIIDAIEGGIAEATDTLIENAIGTDQDDVIIGNDANNEIKGRDGDDVLRGAKGRDTLFGNKGSDVLRGQNGWDTLDGGIGFDRLVGNKGQDLLDGGLGKDILKGGLHADTFQFKADEMNFADVVVDYNDGADNFSVLDDTVRSFADIGVRQNGDDVILDLDGTDFATVRNTLAADIDASDFTFGVA